MGRSEDPRLDGSILRRVFEAKLFPDSKTFVDLPLRRSPVDACEAWRSVGQANSEHIRKWVEEFFDPEAGTDSVQLSSVEKNNSTAEMTEYRPSWCARQSWRDWDAHLKRRWNDLRREVTREIWDEPNRYTLLPLAAPYFVAGGRFRELYYWDSYFILQGLLCSDRPGHALDLVHNFVVLVEKYGFIPNGSRSYYLNRSQPPLFSDMVVALDDAGLLKDLAFRKRAIAAVQKEWHFFNTHRTVSIALRGHHYRLCRYFVDVDYPRPESFGEDLTLATSCNENHSDRSALYRGLASAAESGWDFSSRWMDDPPHLSSVHLTPHIVPACLNTFVLRMEENLARLMQDDEELSRQFASHAAKRRRAMKELLWCPTSGRWCDWDMRKEQRRGVVAASGYFPLWSSACADVESRLQASGIVRSLMEESGLVHPGGVAATATMTGQQWDFPNGWPPIHFILVEGLEGLERAYPGCGAREAACSIAHRFLKNAFEGWKRHGNMLEKYDVRKIAGQSGHGGEYESQIGFGWTNGVVQFLLRKYLPPDWK